MDFGERYLNKIFKILLIHIFLVGSGSKISLNGKYYDELELECKYLEVDQTNPIRRAVWQVEVCSVKFC